MDAIKEKFVNMYIDSLSDEEQEKEERSMDSRILAAMIAAGVTIVVCEYITKKIKK